MKILALVVFIVGVFLVIELTDAFAHKRGYCGHGTKVYNSGQDRAVYIRWKKKGSNHLHKYGHDRMTPGGWVRLHVYWKTCNGVVR